MSLEELQRLLGTPRRTAVKSSGGFASAPSQATSHWKFAGQARGASQASLSVVFAATAPEK